MAGFEHVVGRSQEGTKQHHDCGDPAGNVVRAAPDPNPSCVLQWPISETITCDARTSFGGQCRKKRAIF